MAKSLLVKNEELITITLYYQYKQNKFGIKQFKVLEEQKAKDLIGQGATDIDTLITKWAVPTWQSNNQLVRSSTFYVPSEGISRIDWSKYQDNLFRNCLKEWNITDEEDKPTPVTAESIGSLPSVIAQALLEKYDKCISIDEDDKKK